MCKSLIYYWGFFFHVSVLRHVLVAAPIAQGLLSCGVGEVDVLLPGPLISPNFSPGTREIKKR